MTQPLSGYTVGVAGDRRGDELPALLEARGARVVIAPTLIRRPVNAYRWVSPADLAPLHRLIDLITGRLVDAVTFTATPDVHALLGAATPGGDAVLDALRTDVLAVCVGRRTAVPLRRHGVPVVISPRDAVVESLIDELPKRALSLRVAGHSLTLRGHAAIVDGELRLLAPAPMAVLRTLATAPGRVLSRGALRHALPPGADEHAVEMAVARLRAGLSAPGVIQTVVKRGYRLPV
jgi:uroporphyrinogen-III synthase